MSPAERRPVWQALAAFLALPGVVALLVPWLLSRGADGPRHPLGLLPLALGVALLVWCVHDFHVRGHGTLAPWAPPRLLVVTGPYRFTRNPMYLAVLLMLWGWAALYGSRALALYALVMMLAFHLRVLLGEEPWLARTHGEEWARYRNRVPRWLPAWPRRE